MPKLIDETGNRYGRLLVLNRAPNKGTAVCWHCLCDCGNEKDIRANDLRTGKVVSCGCYQKQRITETKSKPLLPGEKYNKLTIIKRVENSDDNKTQYLCKCDCGNTIIVRRRCLIEGHTKSCGCYITEKAQQRLKPGDRFGKLTVLEYDKPTPHGSKWKCKCDCGTIKSVRITDLISGRIQSCGCINSKGELKIITLLQKHLISYDTQYTFSDCANINVLRFDFFVDNRYLIEYDGEQHFKPIEKWGGEEKLKITKQRDQIKNEYCKTHNIPLIRIPYTHYDKITIDDLRPETSQFLIT